MKRPWVHFYIYILLIIFFNLWLCWVFVAGAGFTLVAASGAYSLLLCARFSLRWLLSLQSTGSRVCGLQSSCGSQALEHRLNSGDAWAYLLRSISDLPRPGIEHVSSALAGTSLPLSC